MDGGSSDGTLELLASYADRYPGRLIYVSGPDRSAGDAANRGWAIAKGDIFQFMGSDDTLEPDAVETVVEFFRANPHAYFVYGDCNIINDTGEVTGKSPATDFDLKKAVNDFDIWCIPSVSAFYKRAVIETVGLCNTSLYACDTDYWIRVGELFRMHRIEKMLASFRVRHDSFGASSEATKKCIRDHFIISRRHGGSLHSPCARKYYRQVITEGLRPVIGRFYPFMNKVLLRGQTGSNSVSTVNGGTKDSSEITPSMRTIPTTQKPDKGNGLQ